MNSEQNITYLIQHKTTEVKMEFQTTFKYIKPTTTTPC